MAQHIVVFGADGTQSLVPVEQFDAMMGRREDRPQDQPNTMTGFMPGEAYDDNSGAALLQGVGTTAVEMTGVPSMIRGASNIARGVAEGSGKRVLGGAAEAGLGMLPLGGVIARPVARALTGTMPRALGTMTAGGAAMLPMQLDDAWAGMEANRQKYVDNDPTVQSRRARLLQLQNDLAAAGAPIPGLGAQQSAVQRAVRQKPILDEINQLQGSQDQPGLIRQAEDIAFKAYMENAPFRERYPGLAETLVYGAGGLAGALSFLKGVKGNFADRAKANALNNQAALVESKLTGTTPSWLAQRFGAKPTEPDKAAFLREQDVLNTTLQSYDKPTLAQNSLGKSIGGPVDATAPYAWPVAKSTGLIMEARMLPEEIDAISFPPDHPTRVDAQNALLNPSYYMGGLMPSILGGMAAGGTGKGLADLAFKRAPDLDRARTVAKWAWDTKGPPKPPRGPQPAAPVQQQPQPVAPPANIAAPPPAGPQGGGPMPQQNPQPVPAPVVAGTPLVPYRGQQQALVRPFIEAEVRGGVTPTQDRLNALMQQNNVPVPTTQSFSDRVANVDKMVGMMRAAGIPNNVIADQIRELMRSGRYNLPAIAAGVLGANALMDQSYTAAP